MKKKYNENFQTILIDNNLKDCIKEISNLEGYKLSDFYEILLLIGLENFKPFKYGIDTNKLKIGAENEVNNTDF